MEYDNTIKSLSPSAARLLLAFLTTDKDESFDDRIARAGIKTYQTYCHAENDLVDLGYMQRTPETLLICLNKFLPSQKELEYK